MSILGHEYMQWHPELTESFIRCRIKNSHLFSGKRYSAARAWNVVIKELKLEGMVTIGQCRKKWENMVRKYKSIRSLPHEERMLRAAQWTPFDLMDSLLGGEEPDHIIIFESCSLPPPTVTPTSPLETKDAPSSPSPTSPSLDSPPSNSQGTESSAMDPCSSVHCRGHTCKTSEKRVAEEEVFQEIKRVCSLLEKSIEVHEKQGERFLTLFEQLVGKNT